MTGPTPMMSRWRTARVTGRRSGLSGNGTPGRSGWPPALQGPDSRSPRPSMSFPGFGRRTSPWDTAGFLGAGAQKSSLRIERLFNVTDALIFAYPDPGSNAPCGVPGRTEFLITLPENPLPENPEMKDEGRVSRSTRSWWGRRSSVPLLAALFLVACFGDGTESLVPETAEVGVVLSSTDLSLTIFEVENPGQTRTVGLGPDGSPVTLAVRGDLAAVPLGVVPAIAVVDLKEGLLVRTVGLPQGSGATGAAFLNDSIVLAANPSLNSVTPINVRAGTRGSDIAVGRFPQAVVVEGGRAFVLNAELEGFVPAWTLDRVRHRHRESPGYLHRDLER